MKFGGFGASDARGSAIKARTKTVPSTATGTLYAISRLFGSSSTLALIAGTDANLSLSGANIVATAALGTASQTAVVREASGSLAVEYPVILTGQVATAPPETGARKKLLMGVTASGENNYSSPYFFYDEGRRNQWRVNSSNGAAILSLDAPYSSSEYNTTLDASPVGSYEYTGSPAAPAAPKATIKMDLDGIIDMTTLPAGTTALYMSFPGKVTTSRAADTFQIRSPTPIPGLTCSGTGLVAGSFLNEDGGVGKVWRITTDRQTGMGIVFKVPNTVAAVPSLTVGPLVMVPHPTRSQNARSPEPVGEHEECQRLAQAAGLIRTLDLMRVNNYDTSGHTMTQMAMRDWMPRKYNFDTNGNPCATVAECVAIANEQGVGLQLNVPHLATPTLIASLAEDVKHLDSDIFIPEFSNEVWNGGFSQQGDVAVLGMRAGFQMRTGSAGVVPQTDLMWPNTHQLSATVMAQSPGQKFIYNVSGAGLLVLRARAAVPAGAKLPRSDGSVTTRDYVAGDMIIVGSTTHDIYVAIQDVPTGTSRTNAAYFTKVGNSTDDATAIGLGVPWDIVWCNSEFLSAQYGYRSWMTAKLLDAFDPARLSVGKPRCIPLINVNRGYSTLIGTGTAADNETGGIMQFDDLWRRGVHVTSSLYAGENITPQFFAYTGTNVGTDWTQQARQDVFRDQATFGVTPEQCIDNAVTNGMLTPASRAVIVNIFANELVTHNAAIAAFIESKRAAWNAAHPGDQLTAGQVPARTGRYEFGAAGNPNKGSPDGNATTWDATAEYSAGWALATKTTLSNFVFFTSGGVKRLYRCSGVPTIGLDPASDPANWTEIVGASDPVSGNVNPRWVALFNAWWRHPNMKLFMDELWAAAKNFADTVQNGEGIFNIYSSVGFELTSLGATSLRYGYRWNEDDSQLVSPAWGSAVQTYQIWSAAP